MPAVSLSTFRLSTALRSMRALVRRAAFPPRKTIPALKISDQAATVKAPESLYSFSPPPQMRRQHAYAARHLTVPVAAGRTSLLDCAPDPTLRVTLRFARLLACHSAPPLNSRLPQVCDKRPLQACTETSLLSSTNPSMSPKDIHAPRHHHENSCQQPTPKHRDTSPLD